MKERGPFFIWNQIFQNVAGIMLKLIINVYNYIFACILASNHRILVFIYITNEKFVDKEGKNWSISKNPKCLRKLFLWPFRWYFQIWFVHTNENFIQEKLSKKWLKSSFLPILRVKINIIQKTMGHSKRSFLDLSDAIFRMKKFLLVKEI